ncbi:MAG: hypothetical protein JXJ17_17020 [Anaerolineae bacterium]|nr:hypothetical protein [Anaerolineae bacterium]
MKICPFCAEEIQDEAIVCKHCKRDLVDLQSSASPDVNSLVTIFGTEQWFATNPQVTIHINGVQVAITKFMKSKVDVPVAPGRNTIQAKMGFRKTPVIALDVAAGDSILLRLNSNRMTGGIELIKI